VAAAVVWHPGRVQLARVGGQQQGARQQKEAGSCSGVAPATHLASRMQTGLPSRKACSAASTLEADMFRIEGRGQQPALFRQQ
jgi:hypothetical protein